MRKYTGGSFSNHIMVYPLLEKELYVEPYMTGPSEMYRQLMRTNLWAVIGYSFGDRIIRDIFLRTSRPAVRLVLLHTHANRIVKELERDSFKGRFIPLEMPFAGGDDMKISMEFKDALLKLLTSVPPRGHVARGFGPSAFPL